MKKKEEVKKEEIITQSQIKEKITQLQNEINIHTQKLSQVNNSVNQERVILIAKQGALNELNKLLKK